MCLANTSKSCPMHSSISAAVWSFQTANSASVSPMSALTWQLARHCEPDFATLVRWSNEYWNDSGAIHIAEWFQASLSMSLQLSNIATYDRLNAAITFRDKYEVSKWTVTRIKNRQNDIDRTCVIFQHPVLPQVIVARPVRDACAKVRFYPQTHVLVDIKVCATHTNLCCKMPILLTTTPRQLHDRILHWLRFCQCYTAPELHLSLNIVLDYDGTHLVGLRGNLKDVMNAYSREVAADPDDDDWIFSSSDDGSDML